MENAAAAGLAVVLVCCVIPGENDGDLGAIVEYAKAHMPAVKGVYFQPISYFGVYPPDKIRRITIPDVIRRVAAQCPDVSEQDFGPGAYDHAQCSFNAAYVMDKNGALRPLTRFAPRQAEADAVHRVRKNLALSGRQRPLDADHRRHGLPGRLEHRPAAREALLHTDNTERREADTAVQQIPQQRARRKALPGDRVIS